MNIAEQIICNVCFSKGRIVSMVAADGHFKCPECPNTTWPDEDGTFVSKWAKKKPQDEIESLMTDMARTHAAKEVLCGGEGLPGGSRGSKGRSTAEKMKKPPLKVLNERLFQNFS